MDALPAAGLRLMLLDDVLATNTSIRAVASRFWEADAAMSFTLVIALWIPPEMKNPMAIWIELSRRALDDHGDPS